MKSFDTAWKIAAAGMILMTAVLMHCAGKESKTEIVAMVGDRVITRDEFIRRAEYTIRPPYCKLNSDTHKRIVLNSLIAEKLAAFEAGNDNPLTRSPAFQATIRGRKEQMMRQTLFAEYVGKKIKPDKDALKKRYQLAGREYHVAFWSIGSEAARLAGQPEADSSRADMFDTVYQRTGGMGSPPERRVAWKSRENPAVHRVLFTEPLVQDQVIGPIQVDTHEFLMMKVLGWTDKPVVTDPDIQQRYNDVYDEWEREKSEILWDGYVISLMKNKRLDFNRETFEKMADLFKPMFMRPKPKRMPFMKQDDAEISQQALIDSVGAALKAGQVESQSFFTFDGQIWTVADFMKIYASHPLVFRKPKFSESEFPEQFKFALADLMRDQILNRDAYDKHIDQRPAVVAYTHMWQDALLAKYHQYNYLQARTPDTLSPETLSRILEQNLNPWADSLFTQYTDRIRINIPVFDDITLTRIDMIAMNDHVPYPETVPPFPIMTSKGRLDYGKKME